MPRSGPAALALLQTLFETTRGSGDQRLSLVMGKAFAPRDPLWAKLIDLRRGSSHLFLRYSFP